MTYDVLGECSPHVSAGDLIPYAHSLNIGPELIDSARNLMSQTGRKAHELWAAYAAICLNIRATYSHPLNLDAHFAVSRFGDLCTT
ncbi:hypothetical protein GCM10011507_14460 [Edaphobacter acidisoli]|uniref:Uncharacterized protein n=1 Tax=Edaphobacter acidisoli TaxID=2040573 RepID=A0A916RPD4_9BACT|nr:hypothetical protein GCM10011507_14460 [Edaphobacter acidisoli]